MARGSFTIGWPFIIGCVVVYNLFFGSDDEDKKPIDVKTSISVEQTDTTNKIDETVNRIKHEFQTSEAIQEAKEELLKVKDEIMTSMKKDQEEETPVVEEPPVVDVEVEKEKVIEQPPIEEEEPIETVEEEEPTSIDNMKSL